MAKTSRFTTGFLLGFGAGFVSRDLLPVQNSMMRPVVKGLLKTGVNVLEKGRESLAHMFETLEDLLAEVRTEKKVEREGVVVEKGPKHVKVNVSKTS